MLEENIVFSLGPQGEYAFFCHEVVTSCPRALALLIRAALPCTLWAVIVVRHVRIRLVSVEKSVILTSHITQMIP